jgi:phenylpropionate dioxygenase-like ring-hydroxylating dioxygenase large terminal subunit
MAQTLSSEVTVPTASDQATPTLDLLGLDQTLQPFGRSKMLPAEAYTSDQVFAWEQRHLFAGTYVCVGREDELRASGTDGRPLTQRAVQVGDVNVLLTFASGEVHAFANTCRHRAHELLELNEGNARQSIICPYHAWTYDLSGRLRTAPGYHDVTGFAVGDYTLVGLPVHRWHGWLFVHAASSSAAGSAVPFDEFIGELEGLVAPYDPAALVLGDRHTYVVDANWKVLSENYHECYHCPLIHPELCQITPPSSGDNLDLPGAWVGGTMELRDGMQTMSLTGESAGRPIPGVSPTTVLYAGLVPNLLISAHPDYVMTHRLVPLSPRRTWVECSWYVPDTGDEPPIDVSYAVEFWDLTNKQDWRACESVQRGLESPHFQAGPFSPSEDAVHMFVTTIARAYRGLPIHGTAGNL